MRLNLTLRSYPCLDVFYDARDKFAGDRYRLFEVGVLETDFRRDSPVPDWPCSRFVVEVNPSTRARHICGYAVTRQLTEHS